jgi:hypothetical protein
MKKTASFAILILLFVHGCATMEQKSRLEKFSEISESFERALRMADYTKAARFIDPSAGVAKPDFEILRNIKIWDYKVSRVHVSEDKMKITQDVELHYFRLNGNVLHHTTYPEIWQFQPDKEVWLLETGLPDFRPQRR